MERSGFVVLLPLSCTPYKYLEELWRGQRQLQEAELAASVYSLDTVQPPFEPDDVIQAPLMLDCLLLGVGCNGWLFFSFFPFLYWF